MSIRSLSSPSLEPASLVAAWKAELELEPRLLVVFASGAADVPALARELELAFPATCVVGCSTAGELSGAGLTRGTAVALALDAEEVENVAVEVVDPSDLRGIRNAVANLSASMGEALEDLDPARHLGLVLADGLARGEERLMEALGDCTDFPFVGGSAGDDLRFERTWLMARGQAWSERALLLVVRLRHPFAVVKTQSVRPLGIRLVATDVEESTRLVRAFDGQPAAQIYAQKVGCSLEDIETVFLRHPLGEMVGGEPFVRSPKGVVGTGLGFLGAIRAGSVLELLRSGDIVADTRAALAEMRSSFGPWRGVLDFHCILRAIELHDKGQEAEYIQSFDGTALAGFCTYGEQCQRHVNQTSVLVLFR